MTLGLSDLLSRGGLPGRPPLTEGPVDYVNFHLADDRVLSCVQFGLVPDQRGRLPAWSSSSPAPPTRAARRRKVRRRCAGGRDATTAQRLLAELTEVMRRLNVYRGHVISLSPGQFGPGPQALVAFHRLPRVERATSVVLPAGVLGADRAPDDRLRRAGPAPARGRALAQARPAPLRPARRRQDADDHAPDRPPAGAHDLLTDRPRDGPAPAGRATRPSSLAPSMVVLEDIDLIAEDREPALRWRPAPLRATERAGRAAQRLRHHLRPHHQSPGDPGTRARRAPRADRSRGRTAPPRRCGSSTVAGISTRAA